MLLFSTHARMKECTHTPCPPTHTHTYTSFQNFYPLLSGSASSFFHPCIIPENKFPAAPFFQSVSEANIPLGLPDTLGGSQKRKVSTRERPPGKEVAFKGKLELRGEVETLPPLALSPQLMPCRDRRKRYTSVS